MTRYATQTGHHCVRRFGWDCHGLPIEFEIDKELGIKTPSQVEELGIDVYNEKCRSIVMRFSSEWQTIVERMGRWIDFENDYKTMDVEFMESVWWVFSQLYEKDLVYSGVKVVPYSTACTTPLSNFEANQNYKETHDPAVIVSFPLVSDPSTHMIAWTTTPWTLPSNLALVVNPDFTYVKLHDKALGKTFIMLEKRVAAIFPKTEDIEILEKMPGTALLGLEYVPLFDYFAEEWKAKGAFRILNDTYVTDDSGTGVVHSAPAFGEDDYRCCLLANIVSKNGKILCPVDAAGCFTPEVSPWAGVHVKEADKGIIKHLKQAGRMVHAATIVHSYPFCWRSETPLIYKAVQSWFVNVEALKEKLLANNLKSRWVPQFVQEKRFANWLADARDWSISRNRYWGTPIPIWTNGDEFVCIGSVEELKAKSGFPGEINDLHRHHVDQITIPSSKGGEPLRRVPAVFDCWFESGSMPYAQQHYPFENKEMFQQGFPADFIAEGLDQTRGWFYTLLVISTALFDDCPFKNLIVNGLVLAADGQKMSKRKQNYPDPMLVVNELGADALRLYLINSPVVRAEPLKFQFDGVRDIVKDVFLPWYNAYRFFVQSTSRSGRPFQPEGPPSTNPMDQWILSFLFSLVEFVRVEMAAYRLYTVVPRLVIFIEQLTNWYVRLNRLRLKGQFGEEDAEAAMRTLYTVLLNLTRLMAPFTPFLTELMYQNLRRGLSAQDAVPSVHFLEIPTASAAFVNEKLEQSVAIMQKTIELGRNVRDKRRLNNKIPVSSIRVVHLDGELLQLLEPLTQYIESELNVKEVILSTERAGLVTREAAPNLRALGPRFGKQASAIGKAVRALSDAQLQAFEENKSIEVGGVTLGEGDIELSHAFSGDSKRYDAAVSGPLVVVVDCVPSAAALQEGVARECTSAVQKLRKEAKLQIHDKISLFADYTAAPEAQEALTVHADLVQQTLGVPFESWDKKPVDQTTFIIEKKVKIGKEHLVVALYSRV